MSNARAEKSKSNGNNKQGQKGGFVLGLIVGLLVGLAVALGVALYVNKAPVPFVNKLPQRTAEQDTEEAKRNQNWDPNAPLAGKAPKQAASGVVTAPPAPAPVVPAATTAPAPAPATATAADKKPEPKAAASAPAATAQAAGGDAFIYFVQAGAYTRQEDAEAQRAKLALSGFTAKVMEKEQSGRTVFRVRTGPFETRDEADGQQQKLQAAGIEANLVRVQR
jgi:cell division protein FtsN